MKRLIHLTSVIVFAVCLVVALFVVINLGSPIARAAGPWYVSPSGDNSTCLDWAHACTTIQAAIDKAVSADTIYIDSGTYYENLDTKAKALTFIGSGKQNTFIDGSNTGHVLKDTSGSSVITIYVQDLTIQNGNATDNHGGGIYANHHLNLSNVDVLSSTSAYRGGGVYAVQNVFINGSRFENNNSSNNGYNQVGGALSLLGNLTVNNSSFINNYAIRGGGAIYVVGTATINNTYFENNRSTGYLGGAIYADGKITLLDSQVISNRSKSGGGGIYVDGEALITNGYFFNNLVTFGSATPGGGLYVKNANVHITNTQFISNSATSGCGLMVIDAPASNAIVNSLFARNKDASGSAINFLGQAGSSLTVLHSTIAGPATGSPTASAINLSTVNAGITNTIITDYSIGINLGTTGSAYQDYNLFYNVPMQKSGAVTGGAHNRTGNPQFADTSNDNYHITANSAALDWGTDVGIDDDFDGQLRPLGTGFDIGYDEALFLYLPMVMH